MRKGSNIFSIIPAFLVFYLLIFNSYGQNKWTLPEELHENSGFVFYQGDSILWINDSGNTPALLVSDRKGRNVRQISYPVRNIDWEELTKDARGNYYIGDFGNNDLIPRVFKLYKLNSKLELTDSICFTYLSEEKGPRPFDCEAMVRADDGFHLFTKGIDAVRRYEMCHFVIKDEGTSAYAEKKHCTYDLQPFIVTGAAINPAGRTLALLTYRYKFILGFLPDTDSRIYFFDISDGLDDLMEHCTGYYTLPTFLTTRQYEAIAYDKQGGLYISSERTLFLKPQMRKVRVPKKLKKLRRSQA